MAYTSNPNIAQVRRQAVMMLRRGSSTRAVARHFGYDHSTIVRWAARAPADGRNPIPTQSSRPHHHPRELAPEIVAAIVAHRKAHGRCAEVIHADLTEAGINVSLSSVKRTLVRQELTPSRKWKRPYRTHVARPLVTAPGDLVQADTIHFVRYREDTRYYVYTIIDLYSRYAYAIYATHLSQRMSWILVRDAQGQIPVPFVTVQTDNGPEFGKWFGDMLASHGVQLRHSRVHKPNDNAHIERFNRTIQDECLGRHPKEQYIPEMLSEYLDYYNHQRRHMGIDLARPAEVVRRS